VNCLTRSFNDQAHKLKSTTAMCYFHRGLPDVKSPLPKRVLL